MRKNIALLSDNGEMLLEEINELDIPQDDLGASLEQLEQMEDALDDAGATAETVDTLTTVLQNTEEVSPVALESLMRAHTYLVNRIGFSTESYRYTSKDIALESFMDSAKNIYESIIKVFKKAVDWVVDFFKQLFNRAERLKNTAKKLKQMATDNADKKLSDTLISQMEFSKLLCFKGQLINGDQLYPALNKLFEVMDGIEKQYLNQEKITRIANNFEKIVDQSDPEKRKDAMMAMRHVFLDMPKFKKSPNQTGVKDGWVLGEEVLPFGNKSLFTKMPKEFSDNDMNTGFSIQLSDSSETHTVPSALAHIPFKQVRDIESVAELVEKYLGSFYEKDKVVKELGKVLSKAISFSKINVTNTGGKDFTRTQLFMVLTMIRKVFINFYAELKNYNVSICQAALQFCKANLMNMTSKT